MWAKDRWLLVLCGRSSACQRGIGHRRYGLQDKHNMRMIIQSSNAISSANVYQCFPILGSGTNAIDLTFIWQNQNLTNTYSGVYSACEADPYKV